MKIRQRSKETSEERLRYLFRQIQAVVVIQAMWRSFRVKKMLKAKQKGKKKKGKKKKGKNKKKSK